MSNNDLKHTTSASFNPWLAPLTSTTSSFDNPTASYLDSSFNGMDGLGITYNFVGDTSIPTLPSSFIFNDVVSQPLQQRPQMCHSNSYPPQPHIQLSEPTPVTPFGPPKLFTNIDTNTAQIQNADLWSPASYVSAQSLPHSRSHSVSFAAPMPIQSLPTTDVNQNSSPLTTPQQNSSSPARSPVTVQTTNLQRPSPQPSPARRYPLIAPNPSGSQRSSTAKRPREDDETETSTPKRLRASIPLSPGIDVSEEDKLLLKIRDESFTWKAVRDRFEEATGKNHTVEALQMRYKRLKDRMKVWTETDSQALRRAHQCWMDIRFDIIASKMPEFGATDKWTAKQLKEKWEQLLWRADFQQMSSVRMLRTPTFSTTYSSSPA